MKKSFRSGRILKYILDYLQNGLLLILFLFLSCNQHPKQKETKQVETKKEIYYCPMHPEVQQDHPGICPKPECKGMELVKKEPQDELNVVLQSVNSSVLSNVKTMHPENRGVANTVEMQGYIDYDERSKHDIASRFDGRIEKLYIKYNYQPIHKGDKIFDIYSPELVTAQQNLLFLLNTDKESTDLSDAAKQKLKILGMSDEQIEHLIVRRKPENSVSIFSKWEGHIHEMQNVQNDNSSRAMEPNSSQNSAQTSAISIKEGMYVTRGQTIFNIVDPHNVAVMLQIKTQDIGNVTVNQEVTLEIDETPKMVMTGKIAFIEPVLKAGYKTAIARVYIDNGGHKHKVGTLVRGHINGANVEGLWVPASSVVDLGKKKIVWLKRDGHFIARKIETGAITKDWIEVMDGVTSKDEIALEGHYLTDSEGFIKTTEE
jgi:membrane fusion protein, copper/silver efflux system